MSQQESIIVGLVFRMDGDILFAEFTPVENWHPIDLAEVKRALLHQGLETTALDDEAVVELIERYGKANNPFIIAIGDRTEAVIEVRVEPDKMAAYLTVIPPLRGAQLEKDKILKALKQAGVVEGVLHAEVDAVVAAGKADAKLVARGTAAVSGRDCQFLSLIPEAGAGGLKVDENGVVDYRELELFVTVSVGDPLMKRVPATAGTPGKNVLGEILSAKAGRNYSFAKGVSSATYAPGNTDMLVAAIAGQPIPVIRGMKVEPTLSVKSIDISTGNLEFEGSVNISTDVKSGMKIKVTGDLIIGGTVEAAEICAGGNITIRGGIVGSGEKVPESSSRRDVAHISCGGTISTLFVENARIEAGDSILIGEVAKQSELIATNHVIVGKEGSRKGHIVGGVTRATQFIKAVAIGSPAGLRTEIETGLDPQINSSVTAFEIKLGKLYKEQQEVERVLAYARETPGRVSPEMLQKVTNTQEKLERDIETCEQEKSDLQTRLNLRANARVIVAKQVFGGVVVRIGHKVWQIKEDRGGATFYLQDGDIYLQNV